MIPEPADLKPDLKTGLLELVRSFDAHGTRYALIGGIASGFRGRARFTEDIDVLLEPELELPDLLEDLQSRGFDLDVVGTIREWSEQHTALLHYSGVPIDWLKAELPSLQRAIDRATAETWMETEVRIASAEDLILLKLLAFRRQDVLDIQRLLTVNAGGLDLELVRHELADALPDDAEREAQFDEMVRNYYDEA